ncbi:MAG: DNA mismatch repair protein MutS [Candidatus Fervidibacter sp.]|uniref:DNA mismatch repair protein MutS n=1 Tax=Candidatus Fervidibacter sp. TaxID=3100871 RepID=UPI00404A15E8
MSDRHWEKLTPMFRQYQAIKAKYPDVLLLFRLGDFYEMFGEDAKIGSQVLQLVLTSREIGKGNRVPMCGVPHHAVERYIAKLLEAGYKVAVCDQLEEPSPKKRLVHRDVTRVLTPGTLVEEAFLEAKQYNFLSAICSGAEDEGRGAREGERQQKFGLAVAEVSTGEFAVTELNVKTLWDELARLQPAEVLLPEQLSNDENFTARLKSVCETATITPFNLDPFTEPDKLLCQHFQVTTLDGFGVAGMNLAIKAAALIIAYLQRTRLSALEHLKSLSTYSIGEFMLLDNATRRNLELVQSLRDGGTYGTLLWVLDETVTPMGGRLLRRWILQPLLNLEHINDRLDAVESLFRNTLWRQEIREVLKSVPDLERLVARVGTGTANPKDISQIRSALQTIPKLKQLLAEGSELPTLLRRILERLHTADDLRQKLEVALVDNPPQRMTEGGIFRDGYHPELDELRYIAQHGKELIAALEAKERERTGIKNLRVGYNQIFGYYIEVTKANLHLVPKDYIRKQTLTDVERFVIPELKQLESKVLGAEERIGQLEYQLFVELRQEVARRSWELLETARAVAELDVLSALAEVAAKNHYTRPILDDGDQIFIREGRHPVIELVQKDKPFVPNDCLLDNRENQLLIITGPNAAGKSTFLRQVALIALMAQIGSFVPAKEARIGIVDRIFTRVGAHDELIRGQSTFMVEMAETANILHNATERSLVLIDEIGRGTSTYDGIAIAWAVGEELHRIGCKCLFATHYHHLNELENLLPRVKNYRAAVLEEGDKVVFLYRIVPGGTDRSYGIQVARLAGLPERVIERAKEILVTLESNDQKVVVPPKSEAQIIATPVQLRLFEFAPHPILERLKKIDPDSLTPREALSLLYEIKRKLDEME